MIFTCEQFELWRMSDTDSEMFRCHPALSSKVTFSVLVNNAKVPQCHKQMPFMMHYLFGFYCFHDALMPVVCVMVSSHKPFY